MASMTEELERAQATHDAILRLVCALPDPPHLGGSKCQPVDYGCLRALASPHAAARALLSDVQSGYHQPPKLLKPLHLPSFNATYPPETKPPIVTKNHQSDTSTLGYIRTFFSYNSVTYMDRDPTGWGRCGPKPHGFDVDFAALSQGTAGFLFTDRLPPGTAAVERPGMGSQRVSAQ